MPKRLAYYNEIDPFAAQWLRELIKAGHIAPGDVDERSIEDVLPGELAGYTQCHFFAGIGVWSYALRAAGWPDERPIWTGSCPCQPFSAAGKRGGFDDERHLWPAFFWLIQQQRPGTVFGEQVESPDGRAWLDLVQDDLEATGYAVGAIGLPACGFGAPHIRERLFWVADAIGEQADTAFIRGSNASSLAESAGEGSLPGTFGRVHCEEKGGGARDAKPQRLRDAGRLDNADGERCAEHAQLREGQGDYLEIAGAGTTRRFAVNGFWGNAEWVYCRPASPGDEPRYRPVEPGSFPLAHGASARVGRLRGYGNAIVAEVAKEFIKAYLEESEAR